ncbi:DUF4834 family protein [Bacteroides pyogenes]|uniref:DUF4834 family protein n=1 Tax=Bacteroides pyogenes TaxID=310300 RepID=UPI002A83A761|nr:DUF4834 family protein [Bacteroides pyogenes]MDY4249177.1 DUF4834 family protein [Bacteroides pyogenes]
MSIILFLLFFFIIILLFGLSIIIAILRAIFGFGRNSSRHQRANFEQRDTHQHTNRKANSHSEYDYEVDDFSDSGQKQSSKKIFSKDEGEYVDFEEIKDDSSV